MTDIQKFLGNPWLFLAVLALAVAGYAIAFLPVPAPMQPGGAAANCSAVVEVHFFYLPSCPHCKLQMPENARLAQQYPCSAWTYHDLNDRKEESLLLWMEPRFANGTVATPTTVIGDSVFVGFDPQRTPGELAAAIEAGLNRSAGGK